MSEISRGEMAERIEQQADEIRRLWRLRTYHEQDIKARDVGIVYLQGIITRLRAELADLAQALEDAEATWRREECKVCGTLWSDHDHWELCDHWEACNDGGLLGCCQCLCGVKP